MEVRNAKIESVMLGFEDHGILTCFIHVDYGDGGHQGFGGYTLGGEYTTTVITELLKTLDVREWDDMKGQVVRVKREDGYQGKIKSIGHFMKNQWFEF